MKTGFNKLDNIINLEEPQVIMISGTLFSNLLSGDIANNVSLKQGDHVLEIVSCKKEYLIKRLIINEAKVSYNKWCLKDKYTEKELQEIGQATVNLIEVTKRLPTIIEQEMNLYNLKKVAKLVSDYANEYADREEIDVLIVLDIFPLNKEVWGGSKKDKRYTKKNIKLIRSLKKISSKLKCNIIFIYDCKARESYNTKESICNISRINKYVDKFIVTNIGDTKLDSYIFNVDVYNKKEKIGSCKLKYDCQYRQFLEYDKY